MARLRINLRESILSTRALKYYWIHQVWKIFGQMSVVKLFLLSKLGWTVSTVWLMYYVHNFFGYINTDSSDISEGELNTVFNQRSTPVFDKKNRILTIYWWTEITIGCCQSCADRGLYKYKMIWNKAYPSSVMPNEL